MRRRAASVEKHRSTLEGYFYYCARGFIPEGRSLVTSGKIVDLLLALLFPAKLVLQSLTNQRLGFKHERHPIIRLLFRSKCTSFFDVVIDTSSNSQFVSISNRIKLERLLICCCMLMQVHRLWSARSETLFSGSPDIYLHHFSGISTNFDISSGRFHPFRLNVRSRSHNMQQ